MSFHNTSGYSGYSPHGYASSHASHHSSARAEGRGGGGAAHQGAAAHEDRSSILNSLDFQPIYEMDPSLADGHRAIYDREVQVCALSFSLSLSLRTAHYHPFTV